eukprot:439747_1
MQIKLLLLLSAVYSVIVSSVIYHGPATSDYFRSEFNETVSNLPELSCDQSSYAYFGKTTDKIPVQYYHLTITAAMKVKYSESFIISTCCEFNDCQQDSFCNKHKINNWYQEYNESYDNTTYNQYCGESSLDTNLYILRVKQGEINFVDSVDDSISCQDRRKSYIDLENYVEGEYVVGVGGFSKNNGSYFIQLNCHHYSFPIIEQQFEPSTTDNISLECDTILSNKQLTDTKQVSYYTLNITQNTYLPITVSAHFSNNSTTSYIYLIKNSSETLSSYQLLEQSDSQIILNDIEYGEYYIVIQGYLNKPGIYSVSMRCTPPTTEPTPMPTTSPTFDETTDQVCVSGSALSSSNGKYKYFSWDSSVNGTIYYNGVTKRYLYPYIDELSALRGYRIGDNRINITQAYCNVTKTASNAILNVVDCFDNWQFQNNSIFTNDINMRLVSCNDVCVDGNLEHEFDGEYIWFTFSTTFNGSVYICPDCQYKDYDIYLYPEIYYGTYYWNIHDDYNSEYAYSYCEIGDADSLPANYVFNLDDCFWWKCLNLITSEWEWSIISTERCTTPSPTDAPGVISSTHDVSTDIMCASQSELSSVNGPYKYWAFVNQTNIFRNAQNDRYLFCM